MKKLFLLSVLLFSLILVQFGDANAQSQLPKIINYQGTLLDKDNEPYTGGVPITFEIYENEFGGTPLWVEVHDISPVDGFINTYLGSQNPLDLPFNVQYWVQVTVGNSTPYPRTPLTTVPYAFISSKSDTADLALDIIDGAITQAKLAPGVMAIPTGDAGGDLMGTYPNPQIRPQAILDNIPAGSITQDKLAPNVSTPPSGPAGGDLTGTYPDPLIAVGAVKTDRIFDLSVTNAKIGPDAVTSDKIMDGQVMTPDLADLSVTNAKIGPDAVTSDKIMDGQVMTPDLADLSVTNAKIGPDAVTTDKIMDGEVMTDDIADLNVTNAKIGPDAVTTDKIMDGEVMTDDIADLNVTNAKIGPDAVTTDKIMDGQVMTPDLADLSVTNEKLGPDAVTSDKIMDATIMEQDIAPLQITNLLLGPDAVTTEKILDFTIINDDLADDSVDDRTIADDAVGVSELNAYTELGAAVPKPADDTYNGSFMYYNYDAADPEKITWTDPPAGTFVSPVWDGNMMIWGVPNVATSSPATGNGSPGTPITLRTDVAFSPDGVNSVLQLDPATREWVAALVRPSNLNTDNTANVTTDGYVLTWDDAIGQMSWTLPAATITTFNAVVGIGTLLDPVRLITSGVGTSELLIFDGSIWTSGLVGTANIADDAVTTAKIAPGAVTSNEIATGAVTSTHILDGTIALADMGASSVSTTQIIDGTIVDTDIADGAVTTPKLADLAVTTAKLDNGSVTNAKVANDAIGTDNIIDGAVTTPKLGDLAVTTAKLDNGSVTNAKVANDAIGTDNIIDGAVTTPKLGDLAVTTAKIDDAAVSSAKIADGAVTTSKIAVGAVTGNELAASSVTSSHIVDGTITNADMGANSVGSANIINGAVGTDDLADAGVTTAKLADLAVTTAKLDDGSVTNAKVANNAIGTDNIIDGAVTTPKLGDLAVTTAKINNSAVTTAKIDDAAVTNAKIADGAVNEDKITSGAEPAGAALLADGTGGVFWTTDVLSLPYSETYSGSDPAFMITATGSGDNLRMIATGTGTAGRFEVANPASTVPALYAVSSSTTSAGLAFHAERDAPGGAYAAHIEDNIGGAGRALLVENSSPYTGGLGPGDLDPGDILDAALVVRNNQGAPKLAIKTYGDVLINSALTANDIYATDQLVIGIPPLSVTITPPVAPGAPLVFDGDVQFQANVEVLGEFELLTGTTVNEITTTVTAASTDDQLPTAAAAWGAISVFGGEPYLTFAPDGGTLTDNRLFAVDATLTATDAGVDDGAYTLGIDLANANTWTAAQTFNNGATVASGLAVTGGTTTDALTVTNNATVGGTLGVTGIGTFNNDLDVFGFASMYGGLDVWSGLVVQSGGADVTGNSTFNNDLAVTGNSTVGGSLTVTGGSTLNGGATVANGLTVTGGTTSDALTVTGSATVGGTLGVTGIGTFNNDLDVFGFASMYGGLDVWSGLVVQSGGADVTGNSTFNNDLAVTGNSTVGGSLTVTGGSTLNGGATVANGLTVTGGTTSDALTVTGSATVGGTLGVTGLSTLTGGADVAGGVFSLPTGTTVNEITTTVTVASTDDQLPTAKAAWDAISLVGSEPHLTFAADGGSLTNNRVFVVDATLNAIDDGFDDGDYTLGINLANTNTWTGAQTFNNGATVASGLAVTGGTTTDALTVTNNATVGGTLGVTGIGTFNNDLDVFGFASMYGGLDVWSGLVVQSGGADVTGNSTFNNDLAVTGNSTVGGSLTVTGGSTLNGGATVDGTFTVTTGSTTLNGGATVNGGLTVNSGSTLNLGVTINGGATVNGNAIFNNDLAVLGNFALSDNDPVNEIFTSADGDLNTAGTDSQIPTALAVQTAFSGKVDLQDDDGSAPTYQTGQIGLTAANGTTARIINTGNTSGLFVSDLSSRTPNSGARYVGEFKSGDGAATASLRVEAMATGPTYGIHVVNLGSGNKYGNYVVTTNSDQATIYANNQGGSGSAIIAENDGTGAAIESWGWGGPSLHSYFDGTTTTTSGHFFTDDVGESPATNNYAVEIVSNETNPAAALRIEAATTTGYGLHVTVSGGTASAIYASGTSSDNMLQVDNAGTGDAVNAYSSNAIGRALVAENDATDGIGFQVDDGSTVLSYNGTPVGNIAVLDLSSTVILYNGGNFNIGAIDAIGAVDGQILYIMNVSGGSINITSTGGIVFALANTDIIVCVYANSGWHSITP